MMLVFLITGDTSSGTGVVEVLSGDEVGGIKVEGISIAGQVLLEKAVAHLSEIWMSSSELNALPSPENRVCDSTPNLTKSLHYALLPGH